MSLRSWWERNVVGEDPTEAFQLEVVPPAPAPAPKPKLPCTCGSVHFTAGGAVVSPTADGRCATTGAILSCVRCGRRWAHCGAELVEPHGKSMPPAWAASDLHEAMQARQDGDRPVTPADFSKLRGATRRASQGLGIPSGRRP